jgi:4-hydroxy-tetrahydrodipicolinate synthase
MSETSQLACVFAPVLTPFRDDFSCNRELFVNFCLWLHAQGVGLAIFGTNSEANSLTLEERLELLGALIEAGVPPSALLPGTGACAMGDSVRLTTAAVKAGCSGVLMLPPFYYKPVSDDGLFAAYSEVIERVGDSRFKMLLYHIPQVSGVPLSLELIGRLVERYPKTVIGMKDSSGDLNNTKSVIERFRGFKVYAGSDALLLATMRYGGAGCISATANVNPAAIVRLRRNWMEEGAEAGQAGLVQIRRIFESFPMIAALKAAAAHYGRTKSFAVVRPPLLRLTEEQRGKLLEALEKSKFAMPELERALAR